MRKLTGPLIRKPLTWAIVALLALGALLWLECRGDVRIAAPVTRIDNLEVANYLQLVDGTGPTVKTIASDPSGVITEPRGSLRVRTDALNVQLYQNTNGGTGWATVANNTNHPTASCGAGQAVTAISSSGAATCSAVGGGGGSISAFTDATFNSNVNIYTTPSTAVDFFMYTGSFASSMTPIRATNTNQGGFAAMRMGTGEIIQGFSWFDSTNGQALFVADTGGAVGSAQVNVPANVSLSAAAQSLTNARGFSTNYSVGQGINIGPLNSTSAARTFKVYIAVNKMELTMTANLCDGTAATPIVLANTGGFTARVITLTWTGGGCARVSIQVTNLTVEQAAGLYVYGMGVYN